MFLPSKSLRSSLLATCFITIAIICSSPNRQVTAAENSTRLREVIKSLDNCIIKSVYSFVYQSSYPPSDIEALKESCQQQSDGFKCLKERGKTAPALLRRGLVALVANRQRHHKKYCTNTSSNESRQFVKDIKCIMDNRRSVYRSIDAEFANSLIEILRRNYNDSGIELKYLCCTIYGYRRSIIDSVGTECASSKTRMEEMITSIVPNDLNIICEDEDKLMAKVCPNLEPIKVSKSFTPAPGNGPSSTTLYLIATLGEPDESLPIG